MVNRLLIAKESKCCKNFLLKLAWVLIMQLNVQSRRIGSRNKERIGLRRCKETYNKIFQQNGKSCRTPCDQMIPQWDHWSDFTTRLKIDFCTLKTKEMGWYLEVEFDLKGQGLACKAFSTFLFPNHLIVAALQRYCKAQRSGEVPRVRLGSSRLENLGVSVHWSRDLTVRSKSWYWWASWSLLCFPGIIL